jgi:hypothetical protein
MTIDKEALREAAEKATPGPWHYHETNKHEPRTAYVHCDEPHFIVATCATVHHVDGAKWSDANDNAAFIALSNPANILALLDENEALTARVEELEEELRLARNWGPQPIEEAPENVAVMVSGGVAVKRDGCWFTGMEEPLFQRPIHWEVKWWQPIRHSVEHHLDQGNTYARAALQSKGKDDE